MLEFKSFASGSSGNMYTLTDGKTKIMIEAGIKIRDIKKALDFKVSSVSGVLLSHIHKDHSRSIKDLVKLGVDCYMPHSTAQEIGVNHHRVKTIEADKQFKIGTFTILPFNAEHDVETFGYLIVNQQGKKLLFLTDSYYCRYKFKGLNIIAIEANYSMKILEEKIANGSLPEVMKTRLMRSHFSLENVKDFLRANDLSKVEEIWLLHLSDTNSDAEQFKREIAEQTGKMIYVPSK